MGDKTVQVGNVAAKVTWEGQSKAGNPMMRVEPAEGVQLFGFPNKNGSFTTLVVSIKEDIWKSQYRPVFLAVHDLVQKSEEKTQKSSLKMASVKDEQLGMDIRGYEGNTTKSTAKYEIKATDSYLFVKLFGTEDIRVVVDGSHEKPYVRDKKFHVEKYRRYELKNPKFAQKSETKTIQPAAQTTVAQPAA